MRRAGISLLLTLGLALAAGATPLAYLKLGFLTSAGIVGLRWTQPIRYFVTNRDVDGVTATQLEAAVARAFDTWAAVPRVRLTHTFGGLTVAEPEASDGISVVGFRSRPELDRTLAATTFEIDDVTGQIVESDIFFNTAFAWSVAPAGQPASAADVEGRFDVEAVGLHEVGHLLGLGHSALGETEIRVDGGRRVLGSAAVMFPIAYPAGNILGRTLRADDRAAISDIYGGGQAAAETGSITGRVVLSGRGVFGAHVTALNTRTGDLVGGFSLTDNGDFVIARLLPGVYVLRVEPIDDAEVGSFFDEDGRVMVNFAPAYSSKLVAVPRGGSGAPVTIQVQAK